MAKKKKRPNIRYVKTLRAVSEEFGVSYTAVQGDWRQAGMPVEDDGTYDLVEIAAWCGMRRANRSGVQTRGDSNGNVMDAPALRRKVADAKYKELEVEKLQRSNDLSAGDYLKRTDVERLVASNCTFVRDELTRIPMEFKASFPKSVRTDLVKQLKVRLDLVLTTLSRSGRKIEEMAGLGGSKSVAGPAKKKA